ncbi:MAG: hypothetical protein EOO99_05000 [Pedobacter sp.]|nr:MAG: hypothetical protein EOO99_05000 [Pedobacter sp.]
MFKSISSKFTLLIGLCSLTILLSCKKEYETIEAIDDAKIQAYLQKNNIVAEKDPTGFYYIITNPGTGPAVNNPDSVFFSTVVQSLAGNIYFSTKAYNMQANYLGYVDPAAYRLVLNKLNRGGSAKIILPSYLAYGKNGFDPVPPNEIILTDINLFPESKLNDLDDRFIRQFITDKGLTGFTKLPSRVYRNISTLGTGEAIKLNQILTVKYKGRLLDGTVFDESGADDLEQPLHQLIRGWRYALVGIPVGTKMRVLIPSDIAYGGSAVGAVPANSILDFDIEIVKAEN